MDKMLANEKANEKIVALDEYRKANLLGDVAMIGQIIRINVILAVIVLYFFVGNWLIQKFWPDSNVALLVLITVGMVGAYQIRKRRRNRGGETAASE